MIYANGYLRPARRFSRKKPKAITKDLIRKCFGKDARIHEFAGVFRVTTQTGGKVVITPNKILLGIGGDDAYQGMTQVAGAVRDHWKARGSREFMLAAIAHGEAWSVNIQPDFTDRRATLIRWCVATGLFLIGYLLLPDERGGDFRAFAIFLMAAFLSFCWLKRKALQEEQRKIEAGGFTYPRQTTGSVYADDDACRKGGVL
jgi:hypothetical protein